MAHEGPIVPKEVFLVVPSLGFDLKVESLESTRYWIISPRVEKGIPSMRDIEVYVYPSR